MEQTPNQSTETNLTEAKETTFDYWMEDLEALEKAHEEHPDNEKINNYLKEQKERIEQLLDSLEEDGLQIDRKAAADAGAKALGAASKEDGNTYYTDSEGFVHSSAEDAQAAGSDDWRNTRSA